MQDQDQDQINDQVFSPPPSSIFLRGATRDEQADHMPISHIDIEYSTPAGDGIQMAIAFGSVVLAWHHLVRRGYNVAWAQ